MAAGGFNLHPELRSFLEEFESKHGTNVEAGGAAESSVGWGHENQPPAPAISGALPLGRGALEASQLALVELANRQADQLPSVDQGHPPPPPPPAQSSSLALQPALSAHPQDPNRLDGVVIDWRESYGFVQFQDGRRAYVHNSMCGGTSLLPGQAITGVCVPDTKNPGKWQAQQVERKVPIEIAVTVDGRMQGKVQQWTGNFGFIQFCDGRRAFCHSSFLTGAAAGSMLIEGQSVIGTIQEDPKNPGKWQAQFVEVLPSLAPDNSGRIEGKVTSWNGSYGFIQFSDGRRAYVHGSACPGGAPLAVGQIVYGNVVEDPGNPGKWQAQDVQGEPGRMDGIVTQWSEKGFGFIDFVDGRHAFVHTSACGGKHLSQGEAVSAVVVADQQNQGKWMAKSVILKGPPGEDCTVTDWQEKGGWGFVLLDSGTSAFIHSGTFGGGGNLALGMRLRVTTKYDASKGRMTVEQVTGVAELSVQQLADAAKLAAATQAPQDAVPALMDASAGVVPGAVPGAVAGAMPAAIAGAVPGAIAGTVAAQMPGMAGPCAAAAMPPAVEPAPAAPSMPDLAGEISSLASSLGFTMPGISSPPAPETELSMGIRTAGKVSDWNASGFGFAMMDDGRRVYVHTSQAGGQHLQQGEAITAVVVPDPRNYGKWAAQSVERLGGCMPAVPVGYAQPPSLAGVLAGAGGLAEHAAKRQRLGP